MFFLPFLPGLGLHCCPRGFSLVALSWGAVRTSPEVVSLVEHRLYGALAQQLWLEGSRAWGQ